MGDTEQKYDVVVDVLQKHHDVLWKLTSGNSEWGWGIMDHIRLEQMDQIKKAIQCWKKHKHEWVNDNE